MVNLHLNIQSARVENSRYRAPPKGSSGLPSGKTKGQMVRAARIKAAKVGKNNFFMSLAQLGSSRSVVKKPPPKHSYASVVKRVELEVETPSFTVPCTNVPRGPGDVHYWSLGDVGSHIQRFRFQQMYVAALKNFRKPQIPPQERRLRRRAAFKAESIRNVRGDSDFLIGVELNPGWSVVRKFVHLVFDVCTSLRESSSVSEFVFKFFIGLSYIAVGVFQGDVVSETDIPTCRVPRVDDFRGTFVYQGQTLNYDGLTEADDSVFLKRGIVAIHEGRYDELIFAIERYIRNMQLYFCTVRPNDPGAAYAQQIALMVDTWYRRLTALTEIKQQYDAFDCLMAYAHSDDHDVENLFRTEFNVGDVVVEECSMSVKSDPGDDFVHHREELDVYNHEMYLPAEEELAVESQDFYEWKYPSSASKMATPEQIDWEWNVKWKARERAKKNDNYHAMKLKKFVTDISPRPDPLVVDPATYVDWVEQEILADMKYQYGPYLLPPLVWEEWHSQVENRFTTEMLANLKLDMSPEIERVVNKVIQPDGSLKVTHGLDFSALLDFLPDVGALGRQFKDFILSNKHLALLVLAAVCAAWTLHGVKSQFTKAILLMVEVGVMIYVLDSKLSKYITDLVNIAKGAFEGTFHDWNGLTQGTVFRTEAGDAHTLKKEVVDVIGTAICGGMLCYSGHKSFAEGDAEKFFRALGPLTGAKNGIVNMIDWVLNAFKTVAKWSGGELAIEGFPIFQDQFPQFKDLQQRVDEFVAKLRLKPDFNYANGQIAFALDRELDDLYRFFPSGADPVINGYKRDIVILKSKLVPLLNCLSTENLNSGVRKRPFAVWISGRSGVGKSTMLRRYISELWSRVAGKQEWEVYRVKPSDAVYVYAYEKEFWDSYHGQAITVVDEAGLMREVEGATNDGFMAIIRMVNIFDYPLDMADLPKKGKTNFSSSIVIATSNRDRVDCVKSLYYPTAYIERFDFAVHQCVKEEYSLPDPHAPKVKPLNGTKKQATSSWNRKLDKSKVGDTDDETLNMDFMEFVEIDLKTGNHISAFMSFEEFVEESAKRYKKIMAFGDKAVKSYGVDVKKAEANRPLAERMERIDPKDIVEFNGEKMDAIEVLKRTEAAKLEAFKSLGLGEKKEEFKTEGFFSDYIFPHIEPMVNKVIAGRLRDAADGVDPDYARVHHKAEDFMEKGNRSISQLSWEEQLRICTMYNFNTDEFEDWCDDQKSPIPKGVFMYDYVYEQYSKYLTGLAGGFGNAVSLWWHEASGVQKAAVVIGGLAIVAGIVAIVANLVCVQPLMIVESGKTKTKTAKRANQRKAGVRKVGSRPVVTETEAYTIGEAMIKNMYSASSSCCYRLEFCTDGPFKPGMAYMQNVGKVTFVGGQVGYMNRHILDWMFNEWSGDPENGVMPKKDLHVRLRATDGTNHTVCTSFTDLWGTDGCNFVESKEERDVVFFRHPTIQPRSKIIGRFLSSYDPLYTQSVSATCYHYIPENGQYMNKPAYMTYHDVHVSLNPEGVEYLSNGVYKTRLTGGTAAGMCGNNYWLTDTARTEPMILGVHSSGDGTTAVVVKISKEMVEEAFEHLSHPDSILYDDEKTFTQGKVVDVIPGLGDQFVPIAVVEPMYNRSKNDIVQSELYGKWAEPTQKPAQVTGRVEDGQYRDILYKSRQKINRNKEPMNLYLFEDCVSSYANQVRSHSGEGHYGNRLVPWDEAIAGKAGVWKGIPLGTSAGYMHDLPPRTDGKKYYFGGVDGYDLTKSKALEFIARCEQQVAMMKKKIRNTVVYKDCTKVETLPNEKVDMWKSRQINASPMDNFVICRRYLGAFVVYFMNNRLRNGSALGINPFGEEWDVLAKTLGKYAGVIAGDYSGWDASITVSMMRSICKLIREFYHDAPEEDNIVREMLFLDLFDSKHITTVATESLPRVCVPDDVPIGEFIVIDEAGLDEVYSVEAPPFRPLGPDKYKCVTIDGKRTFFITVVYGWRGGMPSGHFLTTVGNIIVNNCVVRYAIADCVLIGGARSYGPGVPSPLPFIEANMYVVAFGDDNLIGISAELAKYVSQEKLTSAMAAIGLKYTDESKTNRVHQLRSLEEVTFLKRGFRYEKSRGRWVAPLEIDVINDMCQYRRLKSTDDDFRQTCRKAVLEAALHGRKEFIAWWCSVQTHMLEAGVCPAEDRWEMALGAALCLEAYHS